MLKIIGAIITLTIPLVAHDSETPNYFNIARTLQQKGNYREATTYYKKVVQGNPNNIDAHRALGALFFKRNKISDAIVHYKKALSINPDLTVVHFNLGVCYAKERELDKAIEQLNQVIEHQPDHIKTHLQLGIIFQQQRNPMQALEHYKKILLQEPNNVDVLHRAGLANKEINNLDECLIYLQQAAAHDPNNTVLLYDLASLLNSMNKTEKAIRVYRTILDIEPTHDQAFYALDYTLKKEGKLDYALTFYQKFVEHNPEHALGHYALALVYLMQEEFEHGLPEYEWRSKLLNENNAIPDCPLWDGPDPSGKRILIRAEQGLGDTLQFIRYAQLLKECGATVLLELQPELVKLLSRCTDIDQIIPQGKPLPPSDAYIPLMSLPLLCNTTVATIPAPIPYLHADPSLVDYWHKKLSHDTNFKVGLCWKSSTSCPIELLKQIFAGRSLNPKKFAPLATLTGISFYSLQKNTNEQLDEFDDTFTIHNLGPTIDKLNGAFMDTAAIMQHLDLVITVDTSVAQLAGGLGVPVWLLLSHPADWRWMERDTDSPWYPTMRLFRQKISGDWDSVIQELVSELHPLTHKKNPSISLEHLIDTMTQTTNNNSEWDSYIQSIPELHPLIEQMRAANQQLHVLDEQLYSKKYSVFKQEFITLADKICTAHNLKIRSKKGMKLLLDSYLKNDHTIVK